MKIQSLVGYLSLVIVGAISLQACGKSRASTNVLRGASDSAPATTVIPAGKSVKSVSPGLIGRFRYEYSGCRMSGGGTWEVPNENQELLSEIALISDTQFVHEFSYVSGCVVTKTYSILGVDTGKLVLGNRAVLVRLNGGADTEGQCNGYFSQAASGRNWEYKYSMQDGLLSFLFPPVDPCESDEQNEEVFGRF